MQIKIVYGPDGSHVDFGDGQPLKREHKGESLFMAFPDFVSIDVETTGLSPTWDEIIEFGAVRYRNGMSTARFSKLVKPVNQIDEFITALTGITNDMLANAASIKDVLPEFLAFVGDDVVIGHNVHFDINFIYDSCTELGLPPFSNDFVDTMRISRRLYPEWENHKLDTMIHQLGLESRDLHRAENDALITGEAYLKLTANREFPHIIKQVNTSKLRADSITPSVDAKNRVDSPLYNRVCVFTGTLESFTRREAMQLVVDLGGIAGDNVTKKTNFLILGNNDYCTTIKDGKSSKQKKAEKLILEGSDLQIIPESVFLDMLQ